MKLKLWVEGKKIRVECSVFVKKEDFCFALAKSFTITKATCNQREIIISLLRKDFNVYNNSFAERYRIYPFRKKRILIWKENILKEGNIL